MAASFEGGRPTNELDLQSIERSLRRPRTLFSYLMSMLTGAATLLALVPLFSVLYLLVKRGAAALNIATVTALPPPAMAPGGGFGNAIVGTLVIVAIAAVLSVPPEY